MTPSESEQKNSEREALARATAEFLSGGGAIDKLGNNLGPIKDLTWRGESEARWQAKLNGDLPPPAKPRPRPLKKTTPQEAIDRMSAARAQKYRAARDKLAPAVKKLADKGVIRADIARAVKISPAVIDRIAEENGIDLPLMPRRGTRQARVNAELREEWA